MPTGGSEETLARLEALAAELQPAEIHILGDLWHDAKSLDAALIERLSVLNQKQKLILTVGNHDRKCAEWLQEANIEVKQAGWAIDDVWLCHEPAEIPDDALNAICGHIHPVVRLGTHRLQCFWLNTKNQLVLPSFGELTRGQPIQPEEGDLMFVPIDGSIRRLTAQTVAKCS